MENNVQVVNIKVEFECTPIRHIAIQCPNCNCWFRGSDILLSPCSYAYEIEGAECHCPKCEYDFEISRKSRLDESASFPQFYENCLERKTTWE